MFASPEAACPKSYMRSRSLPHLAEVQGRSQSGPMATFWMAAHLMSRYVASMEGQSNAYSVIHVGEQSAALGAYFATHLEL